MQKKISLLYTSATAPRIHEPTVKAIYNLNIDRMTEAACENKRQTEYFLNTLCRTSTCAADASYRAEILQDFIKYPSLLDSLIQIFRGYKGLPEETEELLAEIFRYGVPASSSGMLDCAYEELYVNAHYARNVIAYFSEISELLDSYGVQSSGLCEMKRFCVKMK